MAEIKVESDEETVVDMQPGAQDEYGAGVSVYHLIVDVLGLCPKYQPHRNSDAITVARLLSRILSGSESLISCPPSVDNVPDLCYLVESNAGSQNQNLLKPCESEG